MENKTKFIIGGSILGAVLLGAGGAYATSYTNPFADTGVHNYAGKTQKQIEETLNEDVSETKIVITSDDIQKETTLGEVGVSLQNSASLAADIKNHYAFWNVSNWGKEFTYKPTISVADETMVAFLEEAKLGNFPENATIFFKDQKYQTTEGVSGRSIPKSVISNYVNESFVKGSSLNPVAVTLTEPTLTTEMAKEAAERINNQINNFVYDIGDGETHPVKWGDVYTVKNTETSFDVTVDEEKIDNVIINVTEFITTEGSARHTITDSDGKVLKVTKEGEAGRTVDDVPDEIVKRTKDALLNYQAGAVDFGVNVEKIPDVATARRIEVDVSEQKLYLFENEKKVADWAVSTGSYVHPSDLGRFKARAFLTSQTMRGEGYVQPDVPWVVYYNGNEAIHGAYWHNEFGTRRSRGCVNLPTDKAKQVYDFAYKGMEVWVHD